MKLRMGLAAVLFSDRQFQRGVYVVERSTGRVITTRPRQPYQVGYSHVCSFYIGQFHIVLTLL